ncbi:MAG: hypothetical protein ACK55Z_23840, partial [bacterium]
TCPRRSAFSSFKRTRMSTCSTGRRSKCASLWTPNCRGTSLSLDRRPRSAMRRPCALRGASRTGGTR